MPNVTCKAFVLRTVKYGEHDKMLTLFTQNDGKLSVVAKGASSPKSKYIASAQLFCLSEFVLNSNGKMPYVANAEVIKGFYGLNRQIECLAAASYCAELTDVFYEEQVGEPLTFRLLYHVFSSLEQESALFARRYALAFALKLLGILGIYPTLNRCVNCGKTAETYGFDFASGGLVCPSCRDAKIIFPAVTAEQAAYLHRLLYIDFKKLAAFPPFDKREEKYLMKTVNDYIVYYQARKIKSFELLYSL